MNTNQECKELPRGTNELGSIPTEQPKGATMKQPIRYKIDDFSDPPFPRLCETDIPGEGHTFEKAKRLLIAHCRNELRQQQDHWKAQIDMAKELTRCGECDCCHKDNEQLWALPYESRLKISYSDCEVDGAYCRACCAKKMALQTRTTTID